MSLFDDAAAFMKNRPQIEPVNTEREDLVKRLQKDFDNATRLEIERGLDKLQERDGIPETYPEVVQKIRVWLDD